MLRSNSKAAKANIHKYIIEHFDPTGYSEYDTIRRDDFYAVAMAILTTWKEEKRYNGSPTYESFKDWCQGLPSILDTCYYYNRSAIKDLAVILEDRSKDERAAEEKLTWLIYRELQEANN